MAQNGSYQSTDGANAPEVFHSQDDHTFEKEILSDYDLEIGSNFSNPSQTSSNKVNAWSRKHSCRVLIKRYNKTNPFQVADVQRELNALYLIGGKDNAVPPLMDYFDPANTVFVICEDRQDETLKRYIEGRGPLTGDFLKAVVTQLMSALSVIFSEGFAHLKMDAESFHLDTKGQLTIKEFQHAIEFGKEKTDTLYAAVGHEVKGAEGIWRAPEVFAAEKAGVAYNGRKAVIWTCGVAIYYMMTGQLEKLSNLDHPAFGDRRPSMINRASAAFNNDSPSSSDNPFSDPPSKPHRLSLSYRRRSSATGSSSHSRNNSYHTIPTPHTLINYPGNRLDLPSYARDIISKMLILDPLGRAELIEVAAKVPKEFVFNGTRPLMELAWLDYKSHVGPYAGMGLGADEWKGLADDSSSIYSGISSFSQGFTGLLSGRKKSQGGGNPSKGYYG